MVFGRWAAGYRLVCCGHSKMSWGGRAWFAASFDRSAVPSYAAIMNVRIPPELEAKLARMAVESGRTASEVALDLLTSSVDHDEWFRAEVEKGRASARDGRLIEHEDVVARMDQRYRD